KDTFGESAIAILLYAYSTPSIRPGSSRGQPLGYRSLDVLSSFQASGCQASKGVHCRASLSFDSNTSLAPSLGRSLAFSSQPPAQSFQLFTNPSDRCTRIVFG